MTSEMIVRPAVHDMSVSVCYISKAVRVKARASQSACLTGSGPGLTRAFLAAGEKKVSMVRFCGMALMRLGLNRDLFVRACAMRE